MRFRLHVRTAPIAQLPAKPCSTGLDRSGGARKVCSTEHLSRPSCPGQRQERDTACHCADLANGKRLWMRERAKSGADCSSVADLSASRCLEERARAKFTQIVAVAVTVTAAMRARCVQ